MDEKQPQDDEFNERLATETEQDHHIVHKNNGPMPHTLGKDCWCNPSVEEVS